ncbi:dihydrolipoamide acetyltransferase family protein [Taibaiella chishuiensis]|uniref:Dihydrolipoamide acetyltransferase component of pyruvate dehydrogenase complex n=1 Tax=Taibaiella chishuiensis TaxID=1434707 RepID=A0A2P8DA23_9BACT|nr:dihydrolipoamide acetyltransferase family protein [Taibaiella chishuiensis]PSK94062.1 2-oxoglutarate dehydrogenase E2 component (dihydrolipoamide succinyltransferase) [Taibaiella chishuiensis]
MAIVDLVMPKMGESIMEATVLKWHKQVGDVVKMDETVLEIATDKVDSEVPSTAAGTITEILFKENDVVPVGTVIARIDSAAATASAPAPAAQPAAAQPAAQPQPVAAAPAAAGTTGGNRFYSPLVLNIASKEGIGMAELENIPGTGNEGRVTKKDILNYVANRGAAPAPQAAQPAAAPQAAPAPTAAVTHVPQASGNYGNNVEIVEMDRMRKLIADHMVRSKATSPHVTSFTEADVTNLVKWRDKSKKAFETKNGEKITFTPIFIEAIVKCIKKFPMINCSLDGDKIIIKKDINIGMAAALPSGNLIVPVIKNADTKNLLGLTKDVNYLANAARSSKLKADETQGGTFTLTNVGTFGSLMGTPIINQPQVAILAVGSIKKRPMVLETKDGDVIAIRHMMYLSLSYDHRIVDGSLGASFLTAVANELEAFDGNREI